MTFTLQFVPKADDFLQKLPRDIRLRIIRRLDLLLENPFLHLEHLEGQGYKFRIGDYRAIVDVDFDNARIIVRVIDHRSRVYKR